MMQYVQRHRSLLHNLVKAQSVLALLILLSCLITACHTPSTPPQHKTQQQSVLYVAYRLYQKPIHTLLDLVRNSMTITVAALHANDGTKIWQSSVMTFPVDNIAVMQMTVASSAIYLTVSMSVEGLKGQVAALDVQNGSILWKEALNGSSGSPIAANGDLYMEMNGTTVQSLDGKSGKLLWRISQDEKYDLSSLTVTRNACYFLESRPNSTILRAVRTSDGTEIWRKEEGESKSTSFASIRSIHADEQAVYVVKTERIFQPQGTVNLWTLFALHATDGSPLWSTKPQQSADEPLSSSEFLPLSAPILYLVGHWHGNGSIVSGIRPQDGKLLWTMQTRFFLAAFVPPDHLYGLTPNKGESFCALHLNDGTEAWCTKADYHQSGITMGQDTVYLLGDTSSHSTHLPEQIYALRQSDGSQVGHYAVENDPTRVAIASIVLAQ